MFKGNISGSQRLENLQSVQIADHGRDLSTVSRHEVHTRRPFEADLFTRSDGVPARATAIEAGSVGIGRAALREHVTLCGALPEPGSRARRAMVEAARHALGAKGPGSLRLDTREFFSPVAIETLFHALPPGASRRLIGPYGCDLEHPAEREAILRYTAFMEQVLIVAGMRP